MNPDVSRRSIAEIEERRSAISTDDFVLLPPRRLEFSYTPNRLQEIASRIKMSTAEFLDDIRVDLEKGLAVASTEWTTRNGRSKLQVWGTRWKLVLRPQHAQNSRNLLAVIESVTGIDIPTNRLLLTPQAVRFTEIWNEQVCDLDELLNGYNACRAEIQTRQGQKRDFERQIREIRGRHRECVRNVLRELGRPHIDDAIDMSRELHRMVRRHYSALQVMMNLLRLRTETDQHTFAAIVLGCDEGEGNSNGVRGIEEPMLQLAVAQPVPECILEEDSLIEIISGTRNRRPKRARIRTPPQGTRFILEVDLPSELFSQDEAIEIRTVSRFGMRAHQRAVGNLLDEKVEGCWSSLARLLCEPSTLSAAPSVLAPKFFNENLNEQQCAAVRGALSTPHLFCIQGPPGTGKTTVICELIQQLAATGERVLMVAPTHVALDEVLRRIGSREGVRALRLSWDDAKVANDVRKFTPANVIDPFLERAGKADLASRSRWQVEREAVADARERLQNLRKAQDRRAALSAQQYEAAARADDARNSLLSEESGLRTTAAESSEGISEIDAELTRLGEASREAESEAAKLHAEAKWTKKFAGWLGLGVIGEVRRQRRRLAMLLAQNEVESARCRAKEQDAVHRLRSLEDACAQTEQQQMAANERLREADHELLAAEASCLDHALIEAGELQAQTVAQLLEELNQRDDRLASYQRLAPQFDDLVASAREGGQDLQGLRRDLLAVTNLFCCTTTGVAGSPELRDFAFDTLIVDEASRVTDSEFLIGAVRARRWILVGDEKQLPPYVEQHDEHFIHALSALHRSDTLEVPLEQAVDKLGALWEEDEELHRFRRDSVSKIAQQMLDGGEWDSCYRAAIQSGIDHLKQEVDNPSQALLQAMRDNLIHSLFERVVQTCPLQLKVRLVEQRRMIEPIAAIVSVPVYGGDYKSPSAEDLARHGITPLITTTFPTPITFLDTSLLGIKARDELVRNSFVNRVEAEWITKACRVLDREMTQASEGTVTVSILAFYKAQARLVREQLGRHRFARLRFSVIDAIDRIQGQESDIVFLSFCRTSGKRVSPMFGQWLQDLRRLNVACTRAHRALVFVGQKDLLKCLCANEHAMEFYRHLNHLFETQPESMRVVRQFGEFKP